ncbi:MAG: folate family ECF transporter S component [Oscillospiraceae bacterium]|nr:folate family ECF transporter S component [Oscillospiraceae bacterium]
MSGKKVPTKKQRMATRTLACCALLAALSVVMARLFSLMPEESSRFSIESIPIFLAGLFFGPLAGGLVGFTADFVGCLFSPYPFNPLFCLPPILYGVFGGVSRMWMGKRVTVPRLALGLVFPVVLGSILYQSFALSYVYFASTFWEALALKLASRSVQFGIVLVLDTTIIYLLFRTKIFNRMGLWPIANYKKEVTTMTAEQAIEYIHSVCWKGSIPGLGRTQKLLSLIGNPHQKLKYVHIAGTNGKGSTAAMTASILRKAGYKVGLYTSPYIYKFNERMQINGEPIADEELAAITEWIRPFAQSMEESPTEFELVSCIAFQYFMRNNCDIVVLEVGMGGAMDSTNVIPVPEVAVITNIGLDHTDVLGKTVEEIARTKAGIFKEGGEAVVYRGTPGVEAVFEEVCIEKNVNLTFANFSGLRLLSHGLEGQVFDCGDRKALELPLLGDHQLHNAAVVLSVADVLISRGWNITEENIYDGIRDVSWPGRFDIMRKDPLFIIDGGHNPQCIEALVKNIQDYLADRRVIVLTGVLADKDYADMYKPVMPLVEEFVCITPPNPRRLDATLLAQYLKEAGAKATACGSIPEGVKTAMEKAGQDGVVLSFGSLYTIGDIRNALEEI